MPTGTFLLEPTDISLRVFSLVQLYTAIYLRGDLFDTGKGEMLRQGISSVDVRSAARKWFQRPMMRLASNSVRVQYYSAIPLAVAAMLQRSPMVVAQWMVDAVIDDTQQQCQRQNAGATCFQVELKITDQGWITWILTPSMLEKWLHHAAGAIVQWPLPAVAPPPAFLDSELLWRCLHAYARCSSWALQVEPIAEPIGQSSAIDPMDRLVLLDLLQVIDNLSDWSPPLQAAFYIKAVSIVEQAFERFWRHDPCARVEPISPFRFGLVRLLRNLLAQLLQVGLGIKVTQKL